jgi:hypothetical protein
MRMKAYWHNSESSASHAVPDHLFGGIADKNNFIKDERDEPLIESFKHTMEQVRDCGRNHVHHAGDVAGMRYPQAS